MQCKVKSVATKSIRFTVSYNHSQVHFNNEMKQNNWCIAVHAYGFGFNGIVSRGLVESPIKLTQDDIDSLSDISNEHVRRKIFHLLFAQQPERIETKTLIYAINNASSKRAAEKLSMSKVTSGQASAQLAQIIVTVLQHELSARETRRNILVDVKSILGIKLSPTSADKADVLVNWGNAIWISENHIQLTYYTDFEYMGWFNKKIRRHRLNICNWCGQEGSTVDHIVPISIGGRSVNANVVMACELCNNKARNMNGLQKLRQWIRYATSRKQWTAKRIRILKFFMNAPKRLLFDKPLGYSVRVKIKRIAVY